MIIEMPAYKTYREGKEIYSIDMMLAYTNLYTTREVTLKLYELGPQLDELVWGKKSPRQVMATKTGEDWDRIKHANLSYPILTTEDGKIIDGYHRVGRATMEKHTTIKAYVIPDAMMKKCLLVDNGDVGEVQSWPVYKMIESFVAEM